MHSGLHTRRELLARGGLALGALPLLPWRRLVTPSFGTVRPPLRCVTLGANGVIEPGSTQDYRSCRGFLHDTGTPWVRIWADWPSLQPESGLAPDEGSGAWRVVELDRQIAQAGVDGLSVILSSYRFPSWANGTAALAPGDASYQLEDRAPALGNRGVPKDLRFRLPPDVGPGSPWAAWIDFLARRYGARSPTRKAPIAALELINEPNLQVWPLYGASASGDPYGRGPVTVHRAVAQMFATAQSITARYGSTPALMGPATSDVTSESRLVVPYDAFTALLLDELDRIGFRAGPSFAWSQHNYTDVEYDRGQGSLTSRPTTHAHTTRQMLAGRWAGWPNGDPYGSSLVIPEGGARLTKIAQIYGTPAPERVRGLQAELIQRNARRMAGDESGGIAMVGQYLFYSDPNFDSGLCEVDGAKRPAYATWRSLPSQR